jgi:phage antirepressor YoqD-like protein
MDDMIKVIFNKKFGSIRTFQCNGETWFIAEDVCKALNLGDLDIVISGLSEDEHDIFSIDGNNLEVVNEFGLCKIIFDKSKVLKHLLKNEITTLSENMLSEISNKLDTMRQNMELYQAAQMLSDNGIDISYEEFVMYLRDNGYLMKNTKLDLATNECMDKGLMTLSARRFNSQGAVESDYVHTYVTPKGQDYFLKLFRENDIL